LNSILIGSAAPLKGIAYMVVGGAFLTANDAVLKWLTGVYLTGQIMALRGLFVLLPIAFLVWRQGGVSSLRVGSVRGQGFRAGLVVTGTFLFVTGLEYLPLADAISITFAGPLFITAMAAAILGEAVGWRRWAAVVVGFTGVVLIMRPGSGAMQWAALLPLAASFTGALRDIVTRHLAGRESSVAILAVTTVTVIFAGLLTLPFGWQPVAGPDVLLFALGGILLGSAHYCLIEAFRYAEAALVAPFKYASIIWAVLFGFAIWGDLPDAWTLLGSAVVVASGLYILHRETRR